MHAFKRTIVTAAALALGGGLAFAPMASATPTPAHTSINDCPSGYMCLWTGHDFTGRMMQYQDTGRWQDLPAQAFSYFDNRGDDAAVSPVSNHTSGKICVDGGSRNTYDHNGVKAVYLAHTGSNC
ncbi:peptidase inhibitor family I36 protein [Nocardia miyunensis]|uniref:peptidase inhibitor family I36 protein n=1 Tax=Nocardia miyunensis TaxID=282684 RepID=UPI00082F9E19|nr:peptidase inhibitor family I36 protein [Nocardia miyunensis]